MMNRLLTHRSLLFMSIVLTDEVSVILLLNVTLAPDICFNRQPADGSVMTFHRIESRNLIIVIISIILIRLHLSKSKRREEVLDLFK